MPTPILDPNRAGNFSASSSRKNQEESPLASQLPSWDLLPAHTVLDRRSSTRTPAAPPALPSAAGPNQAPPPLLQTPPPLEVPPSTAAGMDYKAFEAWVDDKTTLSKDQLPTGTNAFCDNCGAALDAGSKFCTGCGGKV